MYLWKKLVVRLGQLDNKVKRMDPAFLKEIDKVYSEKTAAYIKYFSDIREYLKVNSRIKNRYLENNVEFILLNSGKAIAISDIESVNDIRSEGEVFDGLSCSFD